MGAVGWVHVCLPGDRGSVAGSFRCRGEERARRSFPASFQPGEMGCPPWPGVPLLTLPSPGGLGRVEPLQVAGFPPLQLPLGHPMSSLRHRGCSRALGLLTGPPVPAAGCLGWVLQGGDEPTQGHPCCPEATEADGATPLCPLLPGKDPANPPWGPAVAGLWLDPSPPAPAMLGGWQLPAVTSFSTAYFGVSRCPALPPPNPLGGDDFL